MNVCTFVGRLGRDPELKEVGSNKVLSFSVASDTGYGDNKSTIWLDCSVWGRRGESLSQFLTKGTQVTVAGSLSERKYQAKDGQEKTALQMNVNEISMTGGGEQQKPAAPTNHVEHDDAIPF